MTEQSADLGAREVPYIRPMYEQVLEIHSFGGGWRAPSLIDTCWLTTMRHNIMIHSP